MKRNADPELERIRRAQPTFGLFADEVSEFVPPPGYPTERHGTAIKSVSDGQTGAEAELVHRIQGMLGDRHRWSADDVKELLDAAEVPDTLAIRRRLSSQIVNGYKHKRAVGKVMTKHGNRSGREVTLWQNVVETTDLDDPT